MKLFLDSSNRGRVSKFQRKKTILTQGDPAKTVMYIQEGGVKISVVNALGKEAVVALLGPGDFCGEGSLTVCLFGWRQPPRFHRLSYS
jgi:CRP-like cAMP-binding protein